MPSITVHRNGHSVQLINNGLHAGLEIVDWEHADYFGHRLRDMARYISDGSREQVSAKVHIRREESDIVVEFNDHVFVVVPCAGALEIANGIIGMARLLEEEDKSDQIAFDQGLLIRSGVGLGLTGNKHIQKQAAIEAAHNTELRKALRGTGLYQGRLGHPKVVKGE